MMALSEYARPVTAAAAAPTASNRITYANPVPVAGGPPGAGGSATVTGGQTGSGSGQQPAPVRVSFSETWRVVDSDQMEQNHEIDENEDEDETEEEVEEEVEEDEKGKKWKKRKRRKRRKRRRIIVFNYGRELFVYPYRGTRKVSKNETCETIWVDILYYLFSPTIFLSQSTNAFTRALVPRVTTSAWSTQSARVLRRPRTATGLRGGGRRRQKSRPCWLGSHRGKYNSSILSEKSFPNCTMRRYF